MTFNCQFHGGPWDKQRRVLSEDPSVLRVPIGVTNNPIQNFRPSDPFVAPEAEYERVAMGRTWARYELRRISL